MAISQAITVRKLFEFLHPPYAPARWASVARGEQQVTGSGIKGWATCLALSLLASTTVAAAPCGQTTIYRHATIADATSPAARSNMTLVVQGAIIAEVSPDNAVKTNCPRAKTVDLAGQYVMPGLVDTHVHLATEGDEKLGKALLELDIMGGITTVRDMAGDTRLLSKLQAQLKAQEIPGPDLYYSALMAGPEFFADPRTKSSAKGAVAGEVAWM